jgi:serine/threonine protein kinase
MKALTVRYSNLAGENVVVKSIDHSRLKRERNILLHFQPRTPHIRPLLDQFDPDTPSHALVLKYLEHDLLEVSRKRKLASKELKFVAKTVLEALHVLHEERYVHTG